MLEKENAFDSHRRCRLRCHRDLPHPHRQKTLNFRTLADEGCYPRVLGIVFVVGTAVAFAGQTAPPAPDASATKQAEVSFQFDRTGLPVPRFILSDTRGRHRPLSGGSGGDAATANFNARSGGTAHRPSRQPDSGDGCKDIQVSQSGELLQCRMRVEGQEYRRTRAKRR